jgi:hypothetical protein
MNSDRPLQLDDLPSGLVEHLVATLRGYEPTAVAVIVTGSYAVGRATLQSDLDLTVLTALPPRGHYRTWFEPRDPQPLHISAGAASLESWVTEGSEPADWSLW